MSIHTIISFIAIMLPEDASIITATAEYGETITAAVAKDNIMATQFHPEKSGDVGLMVLRNFVEM